MSSPANKLDVFNNFSYHHTLSVASSTEILRDFNTSSSLNSSVGSVREVSGGQLATICNTKLDSRFNIDDVKFQTIFATNPNDPGIVTECSIVITEPLGFSFMNTLRRVVYQEMECDINSVVFVLTTDFVGYTNSGDVQHLNYIKPITLVIYDIEMNTDTKGTVYTLKGMSAAGGGPLGKSEFMKIKDNINIVSSDNTLKAALQHLESKLNTASEKNHAEVGKGRKLRYDINIPDTWNNFKLDSVANNQLEMSVNSVGEDNSRLSSAQNEGTTVNYKSDAHVLDIINNTIDRCHEIKERAIRNEKSDTSYEMHRIITGITSNQTEVTVHIDIIEFVMSKTEVDKANSGKIDLKASDINGYVFDYIYSGMNTDITDFSMVIKEQGTMLLHYKPKTVESETNTNNSNVSSDNVIADASGAKEAQTEQEVLSNPHPNNAVVAQPVRDSNFAKKSTNIKSSDIGTYQEYEHIVAMLGGIASVGSVMTIRGNPDFFNTAARDPLPHNDDDYQNELRKRSANKHTENTSNMNEYMPNYVKVNVYMPLDGYDNGREGKYEKFWYDGWFWVTQVDNTFSNGKFSQKLTLQPVELNTEVKGSN